VSAETIEDLAGRVLVSALRNYAELSRHGTTNDFDRRCRPLFQMLSYHGTKNRDELKSLRRLARGMYLEMKTGTPTNAPPDAAA